MNYLFKTDRLGFRHWKSTDHETFIQMNKDEQVMEFFPNPLSPDESLSMIKRIQIHFEEKDYGLYAVDEIGFGFIGFIGFMTPLFKSEFTPCIEIGWRLKSSAWGRGLATEGAKACLNYGKKQFGFSEVLSWTTVSNVPSERVMQKIGMKKFTSFNHPLIEEGHPIQAHVVYKIEL